MEIIKSKKQHKEYLKAIELLMSKKKIRSSEIKRMGVLALLVEDYEKRVFPIAYPKPSEAIKFRMDQQNLKQKDLIKYFGCRSMVSEVLNGKRSLTLNSIRKLSHGLGISADILIQREVT